MSAWVQLANGRGGINGQRIEYLVIDDRSDPARQRSAVQDLVENKGIVAFVGQFAVVSNSQSTQDYLAEKRIPVIGGDHADEKAWTEHPMYFPIGVAARGWANGSLLASSKFHAGRNLGVMYCAETGNCSYMKDVAKEAAGRLGFKFAWEGQASLAQPDFTAQCLAARTAGVNVLFVIMDLNTVKRLGPQCTRQAFRPEYVTTALDASAAKLPEYANMVLASHVFPFSYQGPETADYRRSMAAFAPDVGGSIFTTNGWASGEAFRKAASAITGTVTPAALLDQLWTFKNETLGRLTMPLSYRRDSGTKLPYCVFPIVVKDGKVEAPDGLTPLCARAETGPS